MNTYRFRRIFGHKTFILTLLCLLTLTVSGAAAAFRNLEVGDQAPPIALKSLDGEEHSLGEKEGSGATIVLFWATWSPRSLVELGDLEKLRAEYGDKGLRILAVNVEGQEVKEEHRERIRSLVREKGFDFPLVMDDGLKTYNEWGVIATPTTAVLDGDGIVAFDLSGYPTGGFLDVDEAIRKALGLFVPEETGVTAETSYEPNHEAMLHFGLGKRHVEKGFMTKALPELSIAAEADSGWADPRIYLGYIHIREGKNDLAASDLEKAEALDPASRKEIRLLRAYLLLREEKVDEALALLQSDKPVEPEREKHGEGQLKDPGAENTALPGEGSTSEPAMVGISGLEEAAAFLKEGRKEDASKVLDEHLAVRLGDLGLVLRKEKELSTMEKMKLMMQGKQEQQ